MKRAEIEGLNPTLNLKDTLQFRLLKTCWFSKKIKGVSDEFSTVARDSDWGIHLRCSARKDGLKMLSNGMYQMSLQFWQFKLLFIAGIVRQLWWGNVHSSERNLVSWAYAEFHGKSNINSFALSIVVMLTTQLVFGTENLLIYHRSYKELRLTCVSNLKEQRWEMSETLSLLAAFLAFCQVSP